MEYLGEWMWAAILGRGLVALAFASAVLATVAFLRGNVTLGRRAFLTHACSTLGVIALIFVLFFGHRYEFQYIWKHLNNEMPMRFVLSAFWGGQEGGFLLWMFWHNVLALFILRRADAWQREVIRCSVPSKPSSASCCSASTSATSNSASTPFCF